MMTVQSVVMQVLTRNTCCLCILEMCLSNTVSYAGSHGLGHKVDNVVCKILVEGICISRLHTVPSRDKLLDVMFKFVGMRTDRRTDGRTDEPKTICIRLFDPVWEEGAGETENKHVIEMYQIIKVTTV